MPRMGETREAITVMAHQNGQARRPHFRSNTSTWITVTVDYGDSALIEITEITVTLH
jgi:hypothetical protein